MKKVLVHIPHSSMEIPPQYKPCFQISPIDLERELLRMTDRYTDELAEWKDRLVFRISRLVCDVERFRDRQMESMTGKGMWVCYTHTSDGRQLKHVSPEHEDEILSQYYDSHHDCLLSMANERIQAHGHCLIVDVHSFPEVPLLYEQHQDARRPDICIGTDDFHTPGKLMHFSEQFFAGCGYSIAFNHPYSGSITPLTMYRRESRLLSVMIEMKRSIYMDEATGAKNTEFDKLKACVGEYLTRLDNFRVFRAAFIAESSDSSFAYNSEGTDIPGVCGACMFMKQILFIAVVLAMLIECRDIRRTRSLISGVRLSPLMIGFNSRSA